MSADRRRMSRDERHLQLRALAWQMIREEGTENLTLARLAERAGVTKPLVYQHFVTRTGLLAALYEEHDARQIALMEAALESGERSLEGRAAVIASAYLGCALAQGRELPGVIDALASSPELERLRRSCEGAFMEKCRAALEPFSGAGGISPAGQRAILGAAEALAFAALNGEITPPQAEDELFETIMAVVCRSGRSAAG